MIKKIASLTFAICALTTISSFATEISDDDLIAAVNQAAIDMEKDVTNVVSKIMASEYPSSDFNKQYPDNYLFVYNTNVELVAHITPRIIGKSLKGVPDIDGYKFRDDIIEKAQKEGSGWVVYKYREPSTNAIGKKKTYFKGAKASDGRFLVVCSGKYANE